MGLRRQSNVTRPEWPITDQPTIHPAMARVIPQVGIGGIPRAGP